jgi:phage-related baseplate assembly protein
MEEDDALRRRTQMAFDGLNTAGSLDAYVFFALGSDGRVRDAAAYSPAPCEMVLTILSHEGDGTPGEALLGKVRDYFGLSADGLSQSPQPSKVRPQGDRLIVQGASIIAYQVSAELTIEPGPDAQIIIASAQAALDQYCTEQHRLGADITLSGLYQALHRPGVSDVKLLSPASSLSVDEQSAAWCSASTITGVADE